MGFALRVGIAPDYDRFSVMPQRGNGLQPRVAASATLGKESILASTATRLRLLCAFLSETDATALRLKFLF